MNLKFGKYQVISELGKGAMGVVYKAFDPDLEREVAIKTISAAESDKDLIERFKREAKSAGRLRHNNIITIYDFGEEKGQIFIAMELLDGTDLDAIIASNPEMDLYERLEIIRQICLGLDYAHRNHIYHRDIKPANIKILNDGQVKIMDFGLATMQTSSLTKTGTIMGTPHYMSPEMIKGENVDGRSDQFAVGVMMYELLTNQKPFSGETISTILFHIMNSEPKSLNPSFAAKFPQVTKVISRAIQKNREHRYPTMKAMAGDIERLQKRIQQEGFHQTEATVLIDNAMETVLSDTVLDSSTLPSKSGKKKNAAFIATAFFVLVAAAAGIYFFLILPKTPADLMGYLKFNVRPWATVESIVNVSTEEAIQHQSPQTPVNIVLPAGKYRITYSNPKWKNHKTSEFEIKPGRTQFVLGVPDKGFIEDAINHFSSN